MLSMEISLHLPPRHGMNKVEEESEENEAWRKVKRIWKGKYMCVCVHVQIVFWVELGDGSYEGKKINQQGTVVGPDYDIREF